MTAYVARRRFRRRIPRLTAAWPEKQSPQLKDRAVGGCRAIASEDAAPWQSVVAPAGYFVLNYLYEYVRSFLKFVSIRRHLTKSFFVVVNFVVGTLLLGFMRSSVLPEPRYSSFPGLDRS
jgi:hypothetical protein